LKPGEIDPNPETKPARPDPIDMDEDELEMLSEARARLANTQGKKAKRKAREKQLEEARRLAALQKRRELKAAGIGVRRGGKKKRGVDLNYEIPFAKMPAIGFYNTEEETIDKESAIFKRIRQETFDNQQKEREKKDKNKRKETEVTAEILNENNLEPTRKRTKLVLPTPQISDQELEEVVKLGQASEYARQQVEESGTPFTGQLLENYTVTPDISKLRTPMLASHQDTVLTEAQNLMALNIVDTPLKGGLNTPLHESDFTSATPQHKIPQTPNTMFQTPFRTPAGEVHATPSRATPGALPGQTPIRDKLNINPEEGLYYDDKLKQKELKDQLRKGLSRLPAPKNDFEVMLPESENGDSEEGQTEMQVDFVEDQADIDDKIRVQKKKKEDEEMKRRSQAVQRNLPRPIDVNYTILRPADLATPLTELQKAEEMIKKEMLVMIHYDSIQTPTLIQCGLPSNSKKSFSYTPQPLNYDKNKTFLKESRYELFTEKEINQVKFNLNLKLI
jgi:pre-mRNA-splicing factor CDC5/CEF1